MAEKEASAEPNETTAPAEDMDLEAGDASNGDSNLKRGREEEEREENDDASKKQKVEKSVEEERLESKPGPSESGPVRLGPKEFGSSVEMFDYFFKLLHYWPNHVNFNKVMLQTWFGFLFLIFM
ncbi:MAG: hypothetical protein Q8807_03480 ['Waltheria sp.' little leaf phytoplasma]|nr:hypothetical protein ['Waltheria sp.' little leaf phytoplasma]